MTFTTFCRLLSQAVIHSRQPVALNWARNSFGLVLTVFLRKICILGIAEYFLIVLFQISEIKKDEIRFKKYIFLLDMFLIVGGRVPVTGILAGMNLSKPGINLSKPGMNLSKPGKKHRNHVIMGNQNHGVWGNVHDDVIKWKHFPRYWPFVRGIHRSRWIPRTKASDAELWCLLWSARINDWVNNHEVGDLRRLLDHYDVSVM